MIKSARRFKMITLPFPDSAWSRVEHLFPDSSASRGRPRRNDRGILHAILWVQQTGEKWHRLPGTFPPEQTCYQRCTTWRKLGIRAHVTELLEAVEQDEAPALSEWQEGAIPFSSFASFRS